MAAAQKAIYNVYETYLYDLSGLDDNLSQSWIDRLSQVTTVRLAQATVRQAQALFAAHENGVGVLHDDKVTIDVTSANSAALADCQDEMDFYVVTSANNLPDPGVARGYFAGAAQVTQVGGKWLVDTFTTTHLTCAY